jgi:YrbI family 3-deoxy-D-manno-octulosonate 8-phosphate phosphatase
MNRIVYIDNYPLKVFFYDFDGVLTDNRVIVSEDGKESVFCNRSDGLAVAKIKEKGITQLIISTETNEVVSARAVKLGIRAIQGIKNKKEAVLAYCREFSIRLEEILYIGNDLNDLELLMIAGYPVCPSDAYPEVKRISRLVLTTMGGHGVVRDLLDHLNDGI